MPEEKPKPVLSKPVLNLKPPPVRRPILPTSRPRKRRKTRRTCCCATCLVLVVLVLLAFVVGCVAYLVLEPRVPLFHLRSIRFVHFNVSLDSFDGAVLTSEVAVRVEVRNPNGVFGVDYGRTHVVMRGGDDVAFGSGSFLPFRQPKTNTTVFKLTTKVKGMLLESGLGKKVRDGYKSKRLKMGSEINTEVGFYAKGWNTFKLPIKAMCEGVRIKDLETGSPVPKCKITLFKIFNINS